MPPSDIRKDARIALSGNWKKGVCIILVNFLISFVISLIIRNSFNDNYSILSTLIDIAYTIISTPLAFGLVISFIKLKRGEAVKPYDFIVDGFSNFCRAWGIALQTLLKMLLPIICLILVFLLFIFSIVFGSMFENYLFALVVTFLLVTTLIYSISRGLLYTLSQYIAYDNPEQSSKDCVLKSEMLMKGNRGNYFLLLLSFMGWSFLSVFTLGIGMLWLMPYISVSEICFYEKVLEKNKENEESVEE